MDVGDPLPRTTRLVLDLSRAQIDALRDGLLIGDVDGRVIDANEAAARLLGLPRADVLGGPIDAPAIGAVTVDGDPFPDDERPTVVATATGQPATAVMGTRPTSSGPQWLRVSATPLPADDGELDRPDRPAMVVTMTDVTRDVVRSHELRTSEELFRLAFRDAGIGMAITSLEGRFLHVNRALAETLGMSRSELLSRTFQQITHPDDLDADLEQIARLVDGTISSYQKDKRYVTMTGSIIRAHVTATLTRDELGRPLHLISHVEDVTAMRRSQDLLERRALYDQLTGLANRSLLLDRLRHALAMHVRNDKLVAVAFVDLDHFKRVNDTLGHDAGDRMLRIVADRMRRTVRPGDTVARIGGDEFVVVLEQVDSPEQADELVRRLLESVQMPLQLDGHLLLPGVSAGLAVNDGAGDAQRILREADTALYVAKDTGRGRRVAFREEYRRAALDRLSVEGDLRAAIQNGDFELHYQPIADLASGQVVGHEALVRWRHPERGLVMPEAFIAIAEDADLIPELGTWVLREAVGFLARHPELPGRVYINISSRQMGRTPVGADDAAQGGRGVASFAETVARTLEEFGIAPTRLGVEIPESGVLDATERARAELAGIARLGVDLVLDAFGTGYSALSSMLSAPVVGVKLDRSFTTRLGEGGSDDQVSIAIATVLRALSRFGIAEGIETEEQRSRALAHGWTRGQGWLFGRPLPESLLFESVDPPA
jgi:diguanylate cyclase (GGDEF)-like protein/PAS domain S-box-containing protein